MATPTVRPRGRAAPTSTIGLVAVALVLVVAAAAGAGVLLIALGALLPAAGALGVIGPLVVPVHGPGLVLVALIAALGAWAVRASYRRLALAVATVCLVAGVALGAVVGTLVATTLEHGGSVNPWRAVWPSSRPSTAIDERPVYATGPTGEPLHLAVQRPATTGAGAAPILVYVHGGGWIGGSDLSRVADTRHFADAGWLAVDVEYTLARPGRPTWDVAGPEVACALTQVAARAASLGGDPTRIVLAGDSAGGQLAISVGYRAAAGDQPSSCGGRVPVPRAVATNYPAVDLVDGYEHGARSAQPSLDAPSLAVGYTGGTPLQVPDRYRAVSGAAAITPNAPPTLVLAPDRDALVPPTSMARFVRAAQHAGIDATLVAVPFANHAYDTFGDGSLGQQLAFTVTEGWARRHTG